MKRSIEDWYLLGVEALADGDLDRAARVLKQLEKKSPEHLLTIELRGDIAKESGNTEEAFAHYQLLIDPMHPLPKRAIGLMNLATLHQSLREVDQAIECVRQATDIYAGIQQVEDEWNARRFLCEMLIDFGRFADAAIHAEELLEEIKLHPKRRKYLDFAIEVRYYLADALRFIGELDESAKHWEKICQLGRKHEFPVELAMGLDGLGVVRQMQGRYVEALALHNESLELDRNLQDEEGQSVSLGNLARSRRPIATFPTSKGYYH
jgi:tetratricopeptide (TPR) repeat protein